MARQPKKVVINGKELELYYISSLAFALGRTTQTIRKWEIAGVIPNSCFRDKNNRRMYTMEQINLIVKIAEECFIKQGQSIANTSFSTKLHKELAEHNKKYFKGA